MESVTLTQALTVYAWFPLAAYVSIILLIARFYHKQTGERTYFVLYLVPIILFGIAAAHYASINRVMGAILGDILLFVAGAIFSVLCLVLFRRMTTGR